MLVLKVSLNRVWIVKMVIVNSFMIVLVFGLRMVRFVMIVVVGFYIYIVNIRC